jgi:hypothetical protein
MSPLSEAAGDIVQSSWGLGQRDYGRDNREASDGDIDEREPCPGGRDREGDPCVDHLLGDFCRKSCSYLLSVHVPTLVSR